MTPVSTSPMPAVAMPGLPRSQMASSGRIRRAARHQRARALEHRHRAVARVQLAHRAEPVGLHRARYRRLATCAASPGCGVMIQSGRQLRRVRAPAG